MQGPATSQLPPSAWIVFGIAVAVMLAIDLLAYRGKRAESRRTTLAWSIVWIAAGLAFGGFVYAMLGARVALDYYAAYAMEKGLSLDNMFVFYVIFQSLGVPRQAQHKVLFWGVLGAIVFRGIFIFLGAAAIEHWEWVSYIFAAILFYAAWHAFRRDPATQEKSKIVEWLSQRLPVSERADSGEFVVRRSEERVATPLLVALIAVELTDIAFAIDSVPAAFSITRDRFVLYTSNIFAILGLRALYLFLAASITRLRYLHYGLAAVLAFAALKILLEDWVYIPPLPSIGIIAVLIGGAVWASLREESSQQADRPAKTRD